MIPDFKTFISESTWNDIRRQSAGVQGRSEQNKELFEAVRKNKKMDFINMSSSMYSGRRLWWSPCNLGADSYNQEGIWLNYNDLLELDDMLKDSEYGIADDWDWGHLISCTCKSIRIITGEDSSPQYFGLKFTMENNTLVIPNFGYMSPPSDKHFFIKKNDAAAYGGVISNEPKYMMLGLNTGKVFWESSHHMDESCAEYFQVRLVKRESKVEYAERIQRELKMNHK